MTATFSLVPYLPAPQALYAFGGFILISALCLVLGALVTGRRSLPEIQLVSGWGLICLIMTLWGIGLDLSLRIPLAALTMIGLAALIKPRLGSTKTLWRLGILTLPLWLIALALHPSQIDTWLNLLPNAAYLFDYGVFPTATRPDSYSFLPGAPYNTQFIAFAASVFSGNFAPSVMSWFNILLCCATGLLFARALVDTTDDPVPFLPWWAIAAGFLLAIPLNPGFVPRIFFSSYGEAPLAVTAVFAVLLATDLLRQLDRGEYPKSSVTALTLVLVAMVNTKQSGLGLVLAVCGATLSVGWIMMPKSRLFALWLVIAVSLPPIAMYLIWQYFVTRAHVDELTPMPMSAWNFSLIPQILGGMAHAAWQKATFFIAELAVFVACFVEYRWGGISRTKLFLGIATATILLFNGFLIFTYIAHFPPDWAIRAHSYFRYSAQLSFIVMLALIFWARDRLAHYFQGLATRTQRIWGVGVVALALIAPLIGLPYLRFDLDAPQPALRDLARKLAPFIHEGDRLALVVPGDSSDSVGSFLRGTLLFTDPRRREIDFLTETEASDVVLQQAADEGYHLALVTCIPDTMTGIEPGVSALLRFADGKWQTITIWHPPENLATQHFSAMMARGPLCVAD